MTHAFPTRRSSDLCLTEPHAGTDLGIIRTKAEPQADGSYKVSGTKIFITGGEHDLTENIIHLVLAKLPDAPAGPKRSEEHTSELQSLMRISYAVLCLKKTNTCTHQNHTTNS